MSALQSLGFVLGTSVAAGLNVYATVAALGLLHRCHVIQLPPSLEVLAHPLVLAIACILYVVEFIADKIPYVDNLWDVIHTFIRPPAAALLAYAAVGSVAEPWPVAAALLAGGISLTSHGAKASARVAVNASPEPVSNSIASLGEDAVALSLTYLAATHPLLTMTIALALVALSAFLIWKFFGLVRRSLARVLARRSAGQG